MSKFTAIVLAIGIFFTGVSAGIKIERHVFHPGYAEHIGQTP